MPLILVVEQESRYIERVRDALVADGWAVKVVGGRDEAVSTAASEGPALVLINAGLEEGPSLIEQFARRNGGPGVVPLVPEDKAAQAPMIGGKSDGYLVKPFTDDELRRLVRRCASEITSAPAMKRPQATQKLTSAEIFGDVLAEVKEGIQPASEPASTRLRRKPRHRSTEGEEEIQRKLEETLSGVLDEVPRAKPKRAPRTVRKSADVDDLLSETLSSLDLGKRKPAAAPPRSGSSEPGPPPEMATQRIPTLKPTADGLQDFGQYTLLEKIAVGGMAEVWKARMRGMEGFQKTVAIKKILSHLTDNSSFVTMFIDEAKLAAQLNHPNITHIYDLGKIEDSHYIAMEFVEGRNLRSILTAAAQEGKPLPVGLALLIASRLASALDYAHRKKGFDDRELGLVHRDVSPQNVLISYEGDIKLCDFGIVKAVSKTSHTQMGALKGKLQYMSPEQAWGREVDSRSDIFSLGVLLFETLTGRRLFPGENEFTVLEAVRSCQVQRPREIEPSVPESVDAIVSRALRENADERWSTAGEMQQELERMLYALRPTPSQADLAAYMHDLFGSEAGWSPMEDTDTSRSLGDSSALEKAAEEIALEIDPEASVAPEDALAAPAEALFESDSGMLELPDLESVAPSPGELLFEDSAEPLVEKPAPPPELDPDTAQRELAALESALAAPAKPSTIQPAGAPLVTEAIRPDDLESLVAASAAEAQAPAEFQSTSEAPSAPPAPSVSPPATTVFEPPLPLESVDPEPPSASAAPAGESLSAPATADSDVEAVPPLPSSEIREEAPPRKSRLWLWLLLLAAAVVAAYLLYDRFAGPGPEDSAPAAQPAAQVPLHATPPPAAETQLPEGGADGEAAAAEAGGEASEANPAQGAGTETGAADEPEEAAAPDIDDMVNEALAKKEQEIREQREADLRRMERQVAAAKAEEEKRRKEAEEALQGLDEEEDPPSGEGADRPPVVSGPGDP